MSVDKLELLGPAMNAIGADAHQSIGGEPDGIFLYVEIGDGWVEPSLFKDEGAYLKYYWGSNELPDLIMDAWCLEPKDKRWIAMQYTISNGRFEAKFDFDDLEHSDEDSDDRLDRILHTRFGDKPVKYPPLTGDDIFHLKPPA
ncbi:hypothetical protein [Sphingomonas bacterium]|uniref:hypothetical protein n=1 Tax=Sphingomonas bacterium TaxID=1895847 RepID=UPI001576D9D7|nr:hypothetical protein [Sphingomonas bacterium]